MHILFDDDCYFFFKATKTEASVMKVVLRYENVSGQAINFNKSSVIFSQNTTVAIGDWYVKLWKWKKLICVVILGHPSEYGEKKK